MRIGNLAKVGGSNFSELFPPFEKTETQIKVTGFVQGVGISDWNYEEDQLIVTFSDSKKATRRKWFKNPESDPYILGLDDMKKDLAILRRFEDVKRMVVGSFITENEWNAIFPDSDEDIPFESYVDRIKSGIPLGVVFDDLLLKITLQKSSGLKPAWIIPNSYYIGRNSESFQAVKFVKNNNKYDDVVEMELSNEQPDSFNTPTLPPIDSIPSFDPSSLDALRVV